MDQEEKEGKEQRERVDQEEKEGSGGGTDTQFVRWAERGGRHERGERHTERGSERTTTLCPPGRIFRREWQVVGAQVVHAAQVATGPVVAMAAVSGVSAVGSGGALIGVAGAVAGVAGVPLING